MYHVFHKLSQALVAKGTNVQILARIYPSSQFEIVQYS
jgi:hypothetical protein